MAQILMAHSPGLARTIIMVPTCHFDGWNLPCLELLFFHGPKQVGASEVLL